MAIWGRRDSERPAEEADEAQSPAEAEETQSPAEPEDQAGESADEPAPAFWRAQGEEPGPSERAPDDAPPLEYGRSAEPDETMAPGGTTAPAGAMAPDETMAPGETAEPVYGQHDAAGAPAAGETLAAGRAPAVDDSPAGTGAPGAVLDGKIVEIGTETAVKDPALAEADQAPAAAEAGLGPETGQALGEPRAAQEHPAAAASSAAEEGTASPAGVPSQRWSEIMAMFVDDPRGSVEMAAAAVDSAVDEFVTSVQARQRALASSWQSSDTDTEQLRTTLREYRGFAAQVQQLSPPGETGHTRG